MGRQLAVALLLAATNVVMHAAGSYGLLAWVLRVIARHRAPTLPHAVWTVVRVFAVILTIHLLEIGVWAEWFLWERCFPDRETAYYFSLESYTTVGYGDVVAPAPWRLMGGMEGIVGVLLFGWSTAILILILTRYREVREAQQRAHS